MGLQRLISRCCSLRALLELGKQHTIASHLGSIWPPSQQAATSVSHVQLLSALVSNFQSTKTYSAGPHDQPDPLVERAASSKGASTSSSSSTRPAASMPQGGGSPEKGAAQLRQEPKPRYPFRGTRQPPSLRPHEGGPTPDQVSAALGPSQVTRLDKVRGPYRVPRKAVFAVVELGPTQFKVSPGDLVVSEKLRDVDVNDRVKLGRVLMLGSRHETVIGRPLIPQASVTAVIEEQFQDAKVLIFKKRRRKNSRRLKGHRQELTSLRILDIIGIEERPEKEPVLSHQQQEAA